MKNEPVFTPIFSGLDDALSTIKDLQDSKVILIGGRSGVGKTFSSLYILKEILKNSISSCFFSLEISIESLKKRMSDIDLDSSNDLLQVIDKPDLNISEVENIIKSNETNAKFYFIDYLGLIKHEN